MSLVAWIIVGLLASWIAGLVTGRQTEGCITKIAVGVLGAFIGGALAQSAGKEGIGDLSLRSILLAALGATLLQLVLAAVEGRRN